MANKQIDELTELTSVADNDYLLLYDNDEVGSEKTKKYTFDNLKSNFGGWSLVSNNTYNNEITSIQITPAAGVKYKYIIDGYFHTHAYIQISMSPINSGWNNVAGFTNNAYLGAPNANERCYGEYIVPAVDNGKQKLVTGSLYKINHSMEHINSYNISTVTISNIHFFSYRDSNNNFTGTIEVYKS